MLSQNIMNRYRTEGGLNIESPVQLEKGTQILSVRTTSYLRGWVVEIPLATDNPVTIL